MELNYDILPEILTYFFGFFVIMFLLYRKFIFSIIDPLFIFIFTTSFASVLVVLVLDDTLSIIHFFACQIFLFAGFAFINSKYRLPITQKTQIHFKGVSILEMTVLLLFVLYVTGNLIIFFTKGFTLLSDRPSNSKVADFQGGFGIFRKINWAAGGFVTAGLLFLYLNSRHTKHLILLLCVIFFTALEGSKGSLLKVLISFSFLVYHPIFNGKKDILKFFNRYIPIGLVALFFIFFVVLFKENDSPELAIFAFLRRLLYSGDSILYYYTPINENYFARYSFMDYPSYISSTVLGFLRLAPYKEAFGNVMVENVFPDFAKAEVIVGPNTPFYIEGKIFFGYYGAFLYSFLIGGLYAAIRKVYFSLTSPSAFLFVFLCSICQLSGTLITDTSLFVTILFDTCFFVFPAYILACFIVEKRITFSHFFFIIKSRNH